MDFTDIHGWLDAAKDTMGLLKSAAALLPNSDKRSEIEGKIVIAEESMKRSDAKLARELGLKLCSCTFPPQIMLWKETEQAHVCPNPACGHKKYTGMRISPELLDALARPSGPNSWMAR